jgi:hypothetical protein
MFILFSKIIIFLTYFPLLVIGGFVSSPWLKAKLDPQFLQICYNPVIVNTLGGGNGGKDGITDGSGVYGAGFQFQAA